MAINFPNAPSDGQVFVDTTGSGNRYTYQASTNRWIASANSIEMTVSSTAPGQPQDGSLWWNKDYGRLLVYYQDTDTGQWVDAMPSMDFNYLYAISNTTYLITNTAFSQSNAAYNQANLVYTQANLAYNFANTVNPATAFNIANAAFAKANAAIANTSGTVFQGDLNFTGRTTLFLTPFYRNTPNVTSDYTIGTDYNEMSVGPITLGANVTVNVAGEWIII